MSLPSAPPFSAPAYDIGPGSDGPVRLVPLPHELAASLGEAFAAIDPWARYPYPADQLAGYLAAREPGAPRFLVEHAGAAAGALGLRLDWLRGPHVQFLGILPDHQGKGLGALLLRWLEAQAQGARNLWLTVSDFNGRAIAFYERAGFERAAELPGLVRDDRTEILMRKRLSRT